jgi:uncharacterized phage protein (TIGR02218 family)
MRALPAPMVAAFESGATTHCRCWKAVRRDGAVFGFTDHDRDIAYGGVTYKANTGLEAAEAESLAGLGVGGGEVAGALLAEAITEADIAAGLWDDAAIETWLVDWSNVTTRLLLDSGTVGEIRRDGMAFTCEIRSLAHVLDQEQGRRYESLCDATLGDARCTVDLTQPSRRADVVVSAVPEAQSFVVASPPGFVAGAFVLGTARFTSGANMGVAFQVLGHVRVGATDLITLWAPPGKPVQVGNQLRLSVGCDRRFETCRDRFANGVNYRGFPHIPGNDFIVSYARQGEVGQDGSAVVP